MSQPFDFRPKKRGRPRKDARPNPEITPAVPKEKDRYCRLTYYFANSGDSPLSGIATVNMNSTIRDLWRELRQAHDIQRTCRFYKVRMTATIQQLCRLAEKVTTGVAVESVIVSSVEGIQLHYFDALGTFFGHKEVFVKEESLETTENVENIDLLVFETEEGETTSAIRHEYTFPYPGLS